MPDVLVRDVLVRGVPIATLDKIKARAKRQNRSLQSEMAIIIKRALSDLSRSGDQRDAARGRVHAGDSE